MASITKETLEQNLAAAENAIHRAVGMRDLLASQLQGLKEQEAAEQANATKEIAERVAPEVDASLKRKPGRPKKVEAESKPVPVDTEAATQ